MNVRDLDKLIVAKGLKVAQIPINRPIWSHCSRTMRRISDEKLLFIFGEHSTSTSTTTKTKAVEKVAQRKLFELQTRNKKIGAKAHDQRDKIAASSIGGTREH